MKHYRGQLFYHMSEYHIQMWFDYTIKIKRWRQSNYCLSNWNPFMVLDLLDLTAELALKVLGY